MKMKSWFEDAAYKLTEELTKSHVPINGYDFILDYLKDNQADDFYLSDTGFGEENIEDYARSVIDEFEEYLKSNAIESIAIRSNYQWMRKKPAIKSKTPNIADDAKIEEQEALVFSEEEEDVVAKEPKLLTSEEYEVLKNLYQKALNTSNLEQIADFALKIAWWNDYNNSIPHDEKANHWDTAAEKAINAGKAGGHRCYKKAAEIYAASMDYSKSAHFYEKTFDQGKAETVESNWLIEVAKIGRKHAELSGNSCKASSMFIKEQDVILENSKNFKWFLLYLYKHFFNYGESPLRVALVAAVVIFVCAGLYTLFGIYSSKMDLEVKSFYTSLYYSVVTFTTLGYGDYSPGETLARIVSSIEALSGLFLTSFFLVSIYRKYTR